MSNAWRLILDGPVDAATNMARDRAVQLAREEGSAPPTLRLYRWTRPTVTLGRFQPAEAVDLAFCAENGIDVVRRFTGGRAVLHDHELTYAVVASMDNGVPRGVAASYRHLCVALVAAFHAIGVDAALTAHDRSKTSSAACYLATTRADVSVGVAKLSGSAQVWSGSTVLQHGSFVVDRDVDREALALGLDTDHRDALQREAVSIAELVGDRPTYDRIATAVTAGFSEALGVEFEPGELSERERELENRLRAWTDPAQLPVRGS